MHSLRSFLPCVSSAASPRAQVPDILDLYRGRDILNQEKNLDEIFFWAEAVILSQLARDCSAWSCSLDEIAVNANESFREWAFVLFLPRTSNNLSQTRRWACQECHKSSRKLGREDRWFLDFDCKTLIFHLRLWLWDFDCRNSNTAASSPFRVMTRSPRWWRAIPLNDEPAEGNVDPANVDRSFLSPFLTQRPTIVLMYRQRWCLYRFKMRNKGQSEDMWPSSSTLWIDLMKEKVRRQCLSELMTQRVSKIIRTSLFPQCMIDICSARGDNAPK